LCRLIHIDLNPCAGEPDAPLFRSAGRKAGQAHALWQQDPYSIVVHE
jgi:hypothetical protein